MCYFWWMCQFGISWQNKKIATNRGEKEEVGGQGYESSRESQISNCTVRRRVNEKAKKPKVLDTWDERSFTLVLGLLSQAALRSSADSQTFRTQPAIRMDCLRCRGSRAVCGVAQDLLERPGSMQNYRGGKALRKLCSSETYPKVPARQRAWPGQLGQNSEGPAWGHHCLVGGEGWDGGGGGDGERMLPRSNQLDRICPLWN